MKIFKSSRSAFANFSIKFEEFLFIRRSRSDWFDACAKNLNCLFIPKVEIWLIRRLREYFQELKFRFSKFFDKNWGIFIQPKVEMWLIRRLREGFELHFHSESRDLIDSTLAWSFQELKTSFYKFFDEIWGILIRSDLLLTVSLDLNCLFIWTKVEIWLIRRLRKDF